MKIQSGHSLRRGFQIACCLLLISGFCAVSPIVYADKINDFVEQWQIDKKWIGDFDGMTERRIIRVLVVYNKLGFFSIRAGQGERHMICSWNLKSI